MKYKTIVISDLHLSTPDAQPDRLLKFLEKNPTKNLILNGDIIDTRYLRFFWSRKPEYDIFFQKLQAICHKNNTKLTYLTGNHETFHHPSVQTRLIASQQMKYGSYLICHGDSFEKELSKPNIFTTILFFTDTFFGRIDRNLGTNYAISHFLKSIYSFLTNQKTRFIRHAIAYAKTKKVDGIICGHMHQPEIKEIGGITYMNCWDRTEHCSVLVEDWQGNRKII